MRTRLAASVILVASAACAALRAAAPAPRPLEGDGEVLVFFLPPAHDAERISFSLASLALARADGSEEPLELVRASVEGGPRAGQQLLASGRLPPGLYEGILVRVAAASLARADGAARLMVDGTPVRAEVTAHVVAGRALVVWLRLAGDPVQRDYAFAPRLVASLPVLSPPQLGVYCANAGSADVTVIDHGSRWVTGVLPLAGAPRGIALDPAGARAYVALPDQDQVEVLDLSAGAAVGRIRLTPGDGPAEVALGAGPRLLVLNERSRTVAFVDPFALAELSRVPVGDAPVALALDRVGRRAFVVNRGSASITVLDVGSGALAGTIPTEPEPLRVQLSRDGTRLYVVQRGSMYLASFAVPSLEPLGRGFIGLGAETLKVDPRTDLLYLARAGDPMISVLEPVSLQIVDRFAVPAPPSFLAIDDVENTLLAVLPARRSVAVVDLTARSVVAEVPVGAAPYAVTLTAERP